MELVGLVSVCKGVEARGSKGGERTGGVGEIGESRAGGITKLRKHFEHADRNYLWSQ
jgi:hypothetical protein